ncbi:MAG: hypothetical protein CXT73_04015 [Methanobacteriota archaeon]|nr:MAG: hypothetical protein CXT73_04015 [Euryarchaeota archaeon]
MSEESKFTCEACDYKTDNKKDYNRHLKCKKHLRGGLKKVPPHCPLGGFCSICNKGFKHRSSLSRHEKKCKSKEEEKTEIQKEFEKIKESMKKIEKLLYD